MGNNRIGMKIAVIMIVLAGAYPAFNIAIGAIGLVRMVNAEIEMQHRFCGGHLCSPSQPATLF